MSEIRKTPYILGVDLGVQSVGWAVIDLDSAGRPCRIRRAGVRCFDSGVGSETQISMGKDESANAKRRQARLHRRQLWRRGRRLKKVFHCLQNAGLLPPAEARTPQQRHELINKLDAELAETCVPQTRPRGRAPLAVPVASRRARSSVAGVCLRPSAFSPRAAARFSQQSQNRVKERR